MAAATPRIVELDASPAGLRALTRFYRESYVAEFPDADERESLANMRRYLQLAAQGWYGDNHYHILVAELDGRPVGGVVVDYLAEPRAGVVEFLFTDRRLRARGLGRRLLDASLACLRSDARRHGKRLRALVAEMNDPFRRPDTPDNMDPFERAAIWGRWGFARLDFPYVQPALSARQGAVECLALIARPLGRVPGDGVSATWVREVVAEYLRWAMRIAQPESDRHFRAMAEYLASRRRIALTPLASYIGRDPQRDFDVAEIDGDHADFDAVLALAARSIPHPGRVASPAEFAAAIAGTRAGGPAYHLWRLSPPGSAAVMGMASFFTLDSIGFGGYIVLADALRGRGLLGQLIARIEGRMLADPGRAEGWLIECGDDSAAAFLRAGFAEIPAEFRPPPVGGDAARAHARPERLRLLHKTFGAPAGPYALAAGALLRAVREVLAGIYGIDTPQAHACYRLFRRSLRRASGRVQLAPGCAA